MRSTLCFSAGILLGTATVFGLVWRHHRVAAPPNPPSAPEVLTTEAVPPEARARIHFTDLASASGIHFRHLDGRTPMHYVPETTGSGVAWLDYDQDGYLDLFLVQGGPFPPDPKVVARSPTSRLYRNRGDGTFVDVTEAAGIRHPGFGQGVAVGDYDNDGFPDLFITCFGHCHLFHNEPDGRGSRHFREVTREAGVQLDGWCTCCAFGDIHGNGFLDLFVGRYVDMNLNDYPACVDGEQQPPRHYTCGPRYFRGSPSVLFRNNGDGTFTDVSRGAGLEPAAKALGVLILDFDGDGRSDIFLIVPEFGEGRFKPCSPPTKRTPEDCAASCHGSDGG